MPLSEADARAKLIDPALYARGWKEDNIKREETAGAVEMVDGRARRNQPSARVRAAGGVRGRNVKTPHPYVNLVIPCPR